MSKQRESASLDDATTTPTGLQPLAPGKRTLTQGLTPRRAPSPTPSVAPTASTSATTPAPTDDPFGLHLLPPASIDSPELHEAFENAKTAQRHVMSNRATGVTEVSGHLGEADAPSIADDLLKSLAIAALGAASGYITARIANRLTDGLSPQLNTAVQTALDDGLKDATTKIAGRIAAGTGGSRMSFFASQTEALNELQATAERALNAERRVASEAVQAASEEERPAVIAERIAAARDFDAVATAAAAAAREQQYRESLARWMNAQSQAKLGTSKHGGTELVDAVGVSPRAHFKTATAGVIQISFGQRSPKGPFKTDGAGGTIRVKGMTTAARDAVKDVPIKDLGMAILAMGTIADGFLDAVGNVFGGGALKFGLNESGWAWWEGSTSAAEAVVAARGATEIIGAVADIIKTDLGTATLANATVLP